ncbi:hypothetical protein [Actinomyces culturomici]|uniref:hypothetical protein n=1 Tax=Actinomyces culturomici TaxID=1926276 RepID=UPI00135C559C|nr:hypothetical protein [Actinomyces culturomici]
MDSWKVPITRVRDSEATVDQYGEPVPGAPVSEDLPPGLFAPGGTSEPVAAGTDPVVSQPTVYWRGEFPDVDPADRLVIDGRTYEVDGKPGRWPLGLVVQLRLVENER